MHVWRGGGNVIMYGGKEEMCMEGRGERCDCVWRGEMRVWRGGGNVIMYGGKEEMCMEGRGGEM